MRDYKRITNRETKYLDGEIVCPELARLQELENKIENGTLVELPCKVGDIIYKVVEGLPIQEWKIEDICFNRTYPTGVIWAIRTSDFVRWGFWLEDYGTKWFTTKPEAEAKLRKLKENNNG